MNTLQKFAHFSFNPQDYSSNDEKLNLVYTALFRQLFKLVTEHNLTAVDIQKLHSIPYYQNLCFLCSNKKLSQNEKRSGLRALIEKMKWKVYKKSPKVKQLDDFSYLIGQNKDYPHLLVRIVKCYGELKKKYPNLKNHYLIHVYAQPKRKEGNLQLPPKQNQSNQDITVDQDISVDQNHENEIQKNEEIKDNSENDYLIINTNSSLEEEYSPQIDRKKGINQPAEQNQLMSYHNLQSPQQKYLGEEDQQPVQQQPLINSQFSPIQKKNKVEEVEQMDEEVKDNQDDNNRINQNTSISSNNIDFHPIQNKQNLNSHIYYQDKINSQTLYNNSNNYLSCRQYEIIEQEFNKPRQTFTKLEELENQLRQALTEKKELEQENETIKFIMSQQQLTIDQQSSSLSEYKTQLLAFSKRRLSIEKQQN